MYKTNMQNDSKVIFIFGYTLAYPALEYPKLLVIPSVFFIKFYPKIQLFWLCSS